MKVMLIEDHSLTREGYVQMLRLGLPEVEIIECTSLSMPSSSDDDENCPDLIIVNFEIIGGASLARLPALRERFAKTSIMVVDAPASPDIAVAAHNAGIAGYIPRTMRGETILQALRLVLSGEHFIPAFAIGQPAPPSGWSETEPSAPIASLSPRRQQILGMVAGGAPNKVIARALSVHEVTVKSHLRAIYRTLGVSTRTQAARKAMFAGLAVDGMGELPNGAEVIALPAHHTHVIQ